MRLSFAFLLCFASVALQATPSLVTLDTGEQVIGEVLPVSTPETVVLRSALLGELQLPRARVLSIEPKVATSPPEALAHTAAVSTPVAPPTDEEAAQLEERRVLDTLDMLREFKAPEHWTGNLRFGVNLSQGDRRWTETYARGQLEIKPRQSPNFYRFNGSYTYRQTERADGSQFKSTDKYDTQFIYRRRFWDHWFVQNSLGARVDQIKGIDREMQETIGVGYSYKPSETFEIIFGGGGGVEDLQTDYEDTRSGLNPLANVFQEATWRPLQRTSLVQKFNYYWNPEDSNQFNYLLTAAIRIRFTDLLGFEFSYSKSFDNDVGNGNAQDDSQWRNALVVYF